MSPVLRTMSKADLDELMIVQRQASITGLGHIFRQNEHPFPVDQIRARWNEEIDSPDIDCFVVRGARGEVAGFAATRGNELLHFGTAVHLWGSGLASRAHDEILDHLAANGFVEARLRVFEENHRARRFYERRRWLATGEKARTSFAPHPVLLTYARRLSPGA
jgi:diamine N-acetyltransferase